ncbi:MAG: hypothetical protein ICV68_13640, partial [Pyrinomonadaceae bacterium]|nr:hypothetical protein [Pyrinomonadaceae bacterium]
MSATGQRKRKAANSQSLTSHRALLLSTRLMRTWSLPQPDEADDKEARGRVLVVGGAPELPGAV